MKLPKPPRERTQRSSSRSYASIIRGNALAIAEAAKALEISENTYHRWRNQYGGMKADDAKRLKELERENRRLKAIVADQALENLALKEISKGNW